MNDDLISLISKISILSEDLDDNRISHDGACGVLKYLYFNYLNIKNNTNQDISQYEILFFIKLNEIKNKLIIQDEIKNYSEQIYDYHRGFVINSIENINCAMNYSENYEKIKKEDKIVKRKNKRANYSKSISKILKTWLRDNIDNPYPTELEKRNLCKITGLDHTQINNWFINAEGEYCL